MNVVQATSIALYEISNRMNEIHNWIDFFDSFPIFIT
jgi:hypothetical protein